MSNVLITFLGVGDEGSRRYDNVIYDFGRKSIDNTFISLAIKKVCRINKMLVIGTKGSVWETFYSALTDGAEDETYEKLKEVCSNYTIETELDEDPEPDIPNKEIIEDAYNAERIMQLEEELSPEDKVYIDITHSFRSLPMYLMNCLIFLRNTKGIIIEDILYGMRYPSEAKVKVVSLKSAIDIFDWISGADALLQYGKSYSIYDLLEKDDPHEAEEIVNYSDVFNLNSPSNIKNTIEEVARIDTKSMKSKMGRLAIQPIVDECNELLEKSSSNSQFLFRLAGLQYEKTNYGLAFIALKESFIHLIDEKADKFKGEEMSEKRNKAISFIIRWSAYKKNEKYFAKEPNNGWWNDKKYEEWEKYPTYERCTEEDVSYLNCYHYFIRNFLNENNDKTFAPNFCIINDYRNNISHMLPGTIEFENMIKELPQLLESSEQYFT